MKQKKTCSLNKCNGSGLIPFIKNGKVIPHTFLDCDCREEEHEHYHQVRPSDFDFPMSYSYYRSLCQYHGWPDPGPCELPEAKDEPKVIEHIHRHSEIGTKEFDLLQQTARKADYLQKELNKLTEKKVDKQGKYTIK